MGEPLREQWKRFAALPSGRRFQLRYRQHREKSAGLARKVVLMSLGVAFMLLGMTMLVLPGPGLLVMLIGMALIAESSLFASRLLDRIDLWFARRIKRWRARRAARLEARH